MSGPGPSRHSPRATIRLSIEADMDPIYEYAAYAFLSVLAT
jgi:hypothetical protein